ncbi:MULTISPECIES: helix-turn-helix domain-containing protein [Prevotellaceae]|uniref:Excisionase family DNA binding protein n=1 Tax=Hallella colorans TaxID=1703337 RepID=A0A2U0UFK5_9BACT|nr:MULTISPECIES: helix-turn-helix domain-containing protein [Prevotellaceae]PVX56445.1 excisionase family DNA binding protein [Hallella colorans]
MTDFMAASHGVLNTSDTVYTVPDIALMLGRKECTIRKRIEKGLIPAHKMGRCWYILKSELVAELRDT